MSTTKNSINNNNNNRTNKNQQQIKNTTQKPSTPDLDMINRDPNSLNQFVRVLQSNVFAEPRDDNLHSTDW